MYIGYATEGFSPLGDIPLPPLIRGNWDIPLPPLIRGNLHQDGAGTYNCMRAGD